ncbi:peptide deformylase [Ectothiorhodospiraceae bacterium BW-2]|nr:peptide deformylase [Ectothiorhodospiraceae bacterium BW-2]
MAELEILRYPDPRLKQLSQPVTHFDEALRQFIDNLEQTMRAGPGGVGIAAPQVGYFKRIVLIDVSNAKHPVDNHGLMVLINPDITQWSGMAVGREGCMSVPDYTGKVIRAESISLTAVDSHGKPQQFNCHGFEARAVQHEIDHLDGLLFIDRLVSRRDLRQRQ